MRKTVWFVVCALLGALYACDDNTGSIGVEMIPESDQVNQSIYEYDVLSRTILADSVLARTSSCYLGNYTDEETGSTVKSDFILQFHSLEKYNLPDTIVGDSVFTTELCLYCDHFVGDSLAPCRISLYPLTRSLNTDKSYYTNINPEDYYDQTQQPLVSQTFTLSDRHLTDSARTHKDYYRHIKIKLPDEIGNHILSSYRQHPEWFKNSKDFQKYVNPGYYVKLERGEGVMMEIYVTQLNSHFNYYTNSRLGVKDSLIQGITTISATEEVVQANRVVNLNLAKLLSDNDHSHIKSPSGLFTELTLPVDQLASINDSINTARLVINRYNNEVDEAYALPAPANLLLVRKDSLYSFFENYNIANQTTSYVTKLGTTIKNSYTFDNISHLMAYIRKELREGLASDPDWKQKHPNWNKVVLVPVKVTYDTSGKTLTTVEHDLSLTYAKLRNKDIKLRVIFSKFNL